MSVAVQSSVVFWHSEISVSQPAPFQLHLTAPALVSLTVLPFVSLRIEFSSHPLPVIVRHRSSPEAKEPQPLQIVDLGSIPSQNQEAPHEVFADLRWRRGGTVICKGSLASDSPTTLSVSILPPF
jgi:hypothetical protein